MEINDHEAIIRDMAKRQFELTEKEVAAIRQRENETKDILEQRRLQAVRAYGTGVAMQAILSVVDCHEDSVRQWASQYQSQGLSGLVSKWSKDNASKLSRSQREDLRERLQSSRPDEVIAKEKRSSHGQFWTVSDLQIVVEAWYEVVYRDIGSYRRLLQESGFSYQRTEQVYRSRPSEAEVVDFEAELEKK